MDALTDVLRVARLTGGVFLEASFTAPWCVTSRIGPEDCPPHLTNTASVISFHYVISGRMHVAVDGEDPLDVGGNTIVLRPRNDAHLLASGPGIPPVESHLLIRTDPNGALSSIEHGGGGEATRIVCGYVGSESKEHPLFNSLPRMMAMNRSFPSCCSSKHCANTPRDSRSSARAGWPRCAIRPSAGRWPACMRTSRTRGPLRLASRAGHSRGAALSGVFATAGVGGRAP